MKRHIFTKKGHIHSLLQFAFLHVFPKLFPLKVFSVQFVMLYVEEGVEGGSPIPLNVKNDPNFRYVMVKNVKRQKMTQIPVTLRIWLKTFNIKGFPCNSHVITSKKRISSMVSFIKGRVGDCYYRGLLFLGGRQKFECTVLGVGQNLSAQS